MLLLNFERKGAAREEGRLVIGCRIGFTDDIRSVISIWARTEDAKAARAKAAVEKVERIVVVVVVVECERG